MPWVWWLGYCGYEMGLKSKGGSITVNRKYLHRWLLWTMCRVLMSSEVPQSGCVKRNPYDPRADEKVSE